MYHDLCLQLSLQKTPQRTVGMAANKVPRTTRISKLLNNSEYDRAMAAIWKKDPAKKAMLRFLQ